MNTYKIIYLLISTLAMYSYCEKLKIPGKTIESLKHRGSPGNKHPFAPKTTSTTTETPFVPDEILVNNSLLYKTPNILKVPDTIDIPLRKKNSATMLRPSLLEKWADEIREKLFHVEAQVVHRDLLGKSFADFKVRTRNGAVIVEKMAASLDELLKKRAEAAEAIGRHAEKLASAKKIPPSNYIFDNSINLEQLKKYPPEPEDGEIANNCSSTRRVPLKELTHFGKGTQVELDITSVKVAAEVFDCDLRILQHVYWSEDLLHIFQQNYAQDAMTDFQYFCSAKGFLRHYPAASWESLFNLHLNPDGDDDGPADVYDCRLRPWYVAAGGAPRDILILLDASGSMVNSTNKVHAELFTQTLLSALTDDDQVNVLRFNRNVNITSPISCFNDKLVPANHVNSAAMMSALKIIKLKNETDMELVFREAMRVLRLQNARPDTPNSCQQAIILLTDAIEENFTEIMRELNPTGQIRVFVIWLHDVNGLRDRSHLYGEWLSCDNDGYFANLVTHNDVTEQVMQVLRVLERPLVHQRKERLRVFSDLYAHVEDPRRSEFYWQQKENDEQSYRYRELRRNKNQFLSNAHMFTDYIHQKSLDSYGQYYEGEDLDYRLQISVSVPVFEDTTSEKITIQLAEEKQRNSSRTYPVNRLLGVAGVDIPIEHLKLIIPHYQVGACGSMFIVDHRGNIILHDNLRPTFDGDILKPGYRTVDLLDLEQSATDHTPRNYSRDWLEFRKAVVVDQPKGNWSLYSKHIFEGGLRALLEWREYHWKRVQNHYTAVVVLPSYKRPIATANGAFTQQLAARALIALRSEFSVHPEWLYCKHVDQHFSEPEFEVLHFLKRRAEEPNFKMHNLNHRLTPIRPTLFEKTYLCNEELIARLCKEAIAAEQWVEAHQAETRDCDGCELGSVTAFFASESGLTHWESYFLASGHADPPSGKEWARGPSEAYYKRAASSPGTLVIHAPVTPIRKMRKSENRPPPLKISDTWLTAARTVENPEKGMVGVSGYHFHPLHLNNILKLITNLTHDEDDDERCDGENWSCVLIDEGGWIVSGYWKDEDTVSEEDPAREHLARLYPHAMRALLDANVFKLHWIHDYQGVCLPPQDEEIKLKSAATAIVPFLLKSFLRSIRILMHFTKEMLTILALISRGELVCGDTTYEKEKRHKALRRNYEREMFERLHDDRVLVNRTRFAACDRSRALYQLDQRSSKALESLKRAPKICSWPVVGAVVPKTNLILLAIFNLCPYVGRPVPDPLINESVEMSQLNDPEWEYMTSASRLACWRNRVPLPTRAPHSACFPHAYPDEAGYRQCGPWLPDPEVEDAASSLSTAKSLYYFFTLLLFLFNL